jgi:uncharacterized protein (DUF433 family)
LLAKDLFFIYDVLKYLASGMTYEEILRDFPDLNLTNVLA